MNWVSISSGNGLSPVRHQAITWINAGLSIGLLETNFSGIPIGILLFSFKTMHLKLSSGKLTAIESRGREELMIVSPSTCDYLLFHYTDVIMTMMASQITSLTVVYSTVYSDADQRKHQSSASLAFVWGIHRDRWIPRTKGQLRGKCFHLMTSSYLPKSMVSPHFYFHW